MRLRNKFFLFISLLIIAVIGSLVVTSTYFLNKTLLENNKIYSSNLTDQLATSIYFITGQFDEKIRKGIQGSNDRNSLFFLDMDDMSSYDKEQILNEFFLRLLYPPIGLEEIYFISPEGDRYWKNNRFKQEDLYYADIADTIVSLTPLIEQYWGESFWFSLPQSKDCLYLGMALYKSGTMESSGIIVAGISLEYIESFFKGYNANLGGNIIIFNREGQLVYTNSPQEMETLIPFLDPVERLKNGRLDGDPGILSLGRESYQLTWDSFKDNRLIICHVLSMEHLKAPTLIIKKLLLSLGITALVLSLFLSYFLAGLITKRIVRLHEQINYINKGHFSGRVTLMGSDEIGLLGDSFNGMTAQLEETLQRLAREEVQLSEMELRAVQSEYKALQSQINPHFLYNTLESINGLAKMENQKKIEIIVTSLARLFRNSMKSGNQQFTLKEEINHVRDYLIIQEKLQLNRWTVEFEIPEELLEQPVPRFSLQPLLENAINHGMEKTLSEGMIIVHAYQESPGQFILEVSDNGSGIKEKTLKRIQQDLAENIESEHHGLFSVHRRIKLLWGDNFGLTLFSDGKTGTTCRLILPFRKEYV